MTATTPNAALAYNALDAGLRHDALDMYTWCDSPNLRAHEHIDLARLTAPECHTTACLAGWVTTLSGYEIDRRGFVWNAGGEKVSADIQGFAANLLGITDDQASYLFHVENEEVEDAVAEIFGTRPGPAVAVAEDFDDDLPPNAGSAS